MPPSPRKPVLIIGFVRKEGLERTLLSLVQAGSTDIYLAIDGPKDDDQALVQIEMVSNIQKIAFDSGVELRVWRRKQNLGLAVSVITAIDWFFSEVEEGIILEDDLKFGETFIDFAEAGLERFRSDLDVWMISGNRFDSIEITSDTNAWSTYPLIWGWATWKDRWTTIRELLISDGKFVNSIADSKVRNYWKTGFERASSGKLDSWAAPLAAIQHSFKKYSVLPPLNLVSNVGWDSHATHTLANASHMNLDFNSEVNNFHFSTVDRSSISRKIDGAIERNVYKIGTRNIFSYFAMQIFDWVRFPKKMRGFNLAKRLSRCEPVDLDLSTLEDRTSHLDKRLNFDFDSKRPPTN
jgi:hypothetical protein